MTDQPKDFYKLIVVLSFLVVGTQSYTLQLFDDQVAQETVYQEDSIIYIGEATISSPKLESTTKINLESTTETDLESTPEVELESTTETSNVANEELISSPEISESSPTILETSIPTSENNSQQIKIYIPKITSHEEEVGIEEDGSTIAVGEINQEAWLTHNGDKKLVDVKLQYALSYPNPDGSNPIGDPMKTGSQDAEDTDKVSEAVEEMMPEVPSSPQPPQQPNYSPISPVYTPPTQIPYNSLYHTQLLSSYRPYEYPIYGLSQWQQQGLFYPKNQAKTVIPLPYPYQQAWSDLPPEYLYLLYQSQGNFINHGTEDDISLYLPTIYG